ncbi:hypothetical protein AKJ16_DCAP12546 [Drosera capensis]
MYSKNWRSNDPTRPRKSQEVTSDLTTATPRLDPLSPPPPPPYEPPLFHNTRNTNLFFENTPFEKSELVERLTMWGGDDPQFPLLSRCGKLARELEENTHKIGTASNVLLDDSLVALKTSWLQSSSAMDFVWN